MGRHILAALLTISCWVLSLAAAAHAAEPPRLALVIGNAEYRVGPLRNPVNDAKAMTAVLTEHGFSVIYRQNATKAEMEAAIAEFGEGLEEGATGLFYFAGHGMQVQGRNFLIPVDAEIKSESRVRLTAIDVDVILDQMAAARSRINMMILDACRNNPFERSFRSTGGGLAQINAPEGTLIAYATAPGKVAIDGTGTNGLYTEELVRAIRQPGQKVEDVFKAVRSNVSRRSNGLQTPWEASSLVGDFYFRETKPSGTATPSALSAQQALELALWDAVKNTTQAGELKAYLDQFPKGTFAPLARMRMAALAAQPAAAPAAAAPPPPVLPPPDQVPGLDREGRDAYSRFIAGSQHRAFAIAPGGQVGWSVGAGDPMKAMATAMAACVRSAKAPCRLYAVNQTLEQPAYEMFERESTQGLARLKTGMVKGTFRDESRDFGIPATSEPKREGVHADTPTGIPGGRVILTRDLADMIARGDRPVLIDTLDGNRHSTLPGAYWLRGAGNLRAEDTRQTGALIADAVRGVAGGKDRPVVLFCLSSQCWLSYNAALRLIAAGFSKVYWYRGGVEAWRAAGLPVVASVMHAQF